MSRRNFFSRHFTYANVMATLALFIALSGTAYAAIIITGANVKNETLTGADIKNNTVSTADITDNSLLSRDVRDGSLGSVDLANNSVASVDLKDGNIALVDLTADLQAAISDTYTPFEVLTLLQEADGQGSNLDADLLDGVSSDAFALDTDVVALENALTALQTTVAGKQARVSGSCAVGSSIRSISADGTVTCEVDNDTAYTASAPLAVSGGNQISLNGCATNQVYKYSPIGTWACSNIVPQAAEASFFDDATPFNTEDGGVRFPVQTTIVTAGNSSIFAQGHVTFRMAGPNSVPKTVACWMRVNGSRLGTEVLSSFPVEPTSNTRYLSLSCGGKSPNLPPGPHVVDLMIKAETNIGIYPFSGNISAMEVSS